MSARSLNKPFVSDIFFEDQLLRVLRSDKSELKAMFKEVAHVS